MRSDRHNPAMVAQTRILTFSVGLQERRVVENLSNHEQRSPNRSNSLTAHRKTPNRIGIEFLLCFSQTATF